MIDKLNFFKEYYGLIGATFFVLLSIFGIIYDITFYSNFNINIMQYSGTEDFLFSWLKSDMGVVLFSFYITIVISFVLFPFIIKHKDFKARKRKLIAIKKYKAKIVAIIIFTVSLIEAYYNHTYFSFLILIVLVMFYIFLVKDILTRKEYILQKRKTKNNNKNNLKESEQNSFLWLMLIVLILPIYYTFKSANNDVSSINQQRKEITYNITLIDKTKIENCVLLGTKSNYQLYILENKKVIIVPNNSLLYLEMNDKTIKRDFYSDIKSMFDYVSKIIQ
jgi:hypothetical protein